MTINVKAFEPVLEWLDAGAPHAKARGMKFDMKVTISVTPESPTGRDWCGSACCIAGAAVVFEEPDYLLPLVDHAIESARLCNIGESNLHIWENAKDLLGLNSEEASLLFAPFDLDTGFDENEVHFYLLKSSKNYLAGNSPDLDVEAWPTSPQEINPAWAARTIRHFIKEGEIRWDLTRLEVENV